MQSQLLSRLSDAELVAAVAELAARERLCTASLVAHLGEMLARRLHLAAGYPSLFVYCVKVLRLSGGGAYNRIEAAKAARRFPSVLGLLERGELSLATLRLIAPHLTAHNSEDMLAQASFKTKREVEALLARRFPQPDVPTLIRKLPVPARRGDPAATAGQENAGIAEDTSPQMQAAPLTAPSPRPALTEPRPTLTKPLSADRYLMRFTARAETREQLQRAQDLLRHAVPDGDVGEIVDRALTALIAQLERRKFGATERPHPAAPDTSGSSGKRTIPAAVRRSVVARDQSRCAFVGHGARCEARAFLEFHHVLPYARGGEATVENIQLRCRGHNAHEAELDYGRHPLSSRDENGVAAGRAT